MHLPNWVKSLGRSSRRHEAAVIQNGTENENDYDDRPIERDGFIQRSLRRGRRKVRRSVSVFNIRDRPEQNPQSSTQPIAPSTIAPRAHEAPEIPSATVHSVTDVPSIQIHHIIPVNNNLPPEVISVRVNSPEPSTSSGDRGIDSQDPHVATQAAPVPHEVLTRKKVGEAVTQFVQNSSSSSSAEIPPSAQQSSPLTMTPNGIQIDQQRNRDFASLEAGVINREPSVITEGQADRDAQELISQADQTSIAPSTVNAPPRYQQVLSDLVSPQSSHVSDQTLFIGVALDQSPPYLTQELFDNIFHDENLSSICNKPTNQSSVLLFRDLEPQFEHLDLVFLQESKTEALFGLNYQDAKDDNICVVETESRFSGDYSPPEALYLSEKTVMSSNSIKSSITEPLIAQDFVSQEEGTITASEDTISKEQNCIPKNEDNIPKNELSPFFIDTYGSRPVVLDGKVTQLSNQISSAHGLKTVSLVTDDNEIQREPINIGLPEPANEDLKNSLAAGEEALSRFQPIFDNVCAVRQPGTKTSELQSGHYCHGGSPSEFKSTRAAADRDLRSIHHSNEGKSSDQTHLFLTHDETGILSTVNCQASGDFDASSNDIGTSDTTQELSMNISMRNGEVSWSQKVYDKFHTEEYKKLLHSERDYFFLPPWDPVYRLRNANLKENFANKVRHISDSSSKSGLFAQEFQTEADHNADLKLNEDNVCLQNSQLPESKLFYASRSRSQHGNGRIRALRATYRSGIEDLINFTNDYPPTCPAVVRFENLTEVALLDYFLRQRIRTNWFARWAENQANDKIDDDLGDHLRYDGQDILRRMVDEYQYYGVDSGYEGFLTDYDDSGYEDSM